MAPSIRGFRPIINLFPRMTRMPHFSDPRPESDPQPPYLHIILRLLLVASSVFVLTVLAGVYITNNILPKTYTATAEIQLSPRVDSGLDQTQFQSEFDLMESPEVLLPVIRDLDLEKTWATQASQLDLDQLSDTEALDYMNKILRIHLERGTNIVKITVSSGVPKEAADIANAIAERYKTIRDVEENQQTNPGTEKAAWEKLTPSQSSAFSENPVQIIARAVAPSEPSEPNKSFAFIVTVLMAGILGVVTASFVEVVSMLSRASKRPF